MKRLVSALLVLLVVVVPAWSAVQDKTADSIAAEKAFHVIDTALADWAGDVTKDQLLGFEKCLSSKTTVILLLPRRVGKKIQVKTEKHVFPLATMKRIVSQKMKNCGRTGVLRESKDLQRFNDWLTSDYSGDSRTRLSVGEWKWRGSTMPPDDANTPLRNRIKLVKANGVWKLSEIQIAKGRDLWTD